MAPLTINLQTQTELETYLARQSNAVAQHEIDSIDDVFGTLYRVWGGSRGINLLGTFYKNLAGYWVSQSCRSNKSIYCGSREQAIATILA